MKDGSWVLPCKPSLLQALIFRPIPQSPQPHRCIMLHTCSRLGHFKVFTLRLDLLDSVPFCRKKPSQYSACGPALCTELGDWLWRSFINPKKQHVDRNADKSMAALAPPATATVLCAPALLPRLFSCCDQSTGVSK